MIMHSDAKKPVQPFKENKLYHGSDPPRGSPSHDARELPFPCSIYGTNFLCIILCFVIDCHPEYLDCVSGIGLVVTMDDFACDLGSLDPLSVSIEANSSDTCHRSFDHSAL